MVFVRRTGSTLLLWAVVAAIFASMHPAAYLGLIGVLAVISTIEYFRMLRAADVKCFPRFGLILAAAYCGISAFHFLKGGNDIPPGLDAVAVFVAITGAFTLQLRYSIRSIEALLACNRAILDIAGRTRLPPAPTTFVAALVRPEDDLLLHLSVGDSHVFAVEQGRAMELGGRDPEWRFTPFLGYEEAKPELLEQYAKIGVQRVSQLQAVVLATDGLSEPGIGLEDPGRAVSLAVERAALDAPLDRRAVDVARDVVEAAMQAHASQKAGDNMGCSVLWTGR